MRARKRSSSVVAPLSNVGLIALRSPVYAAVVSMFLGQPPRSDWWVRMASAMRLASALANQSSGFLRYAAGLADTSAGARRNNRARAGTVGLCARTTIGCLPDHSRFASNHRFTPASSAPQPIPRPDLRRQGAQVPKGVQEHRDGEALALEVGPRQDE